MRLISDISEAFRTQSTALEFASTCAVVVAPAMIEATSGRWVRTEDEKNAIRVATENLDGVAAVHDETVVIPGSFGVGL